MNADTQKPGLLWSGASSEAANWGRRARGALQAAAGLDTLRFGTDAAMLAAAGPGGSVSLRAPCPPSAPGPRGGWTRRERHRDGARPATWGRPRRRSAGLMWQRPGVKSFSGLNFK